MAGNVDRTGVVMYVRSQPPEPGPSFDYNQTSMTSRLSSMVFPTGLSGRSPEMRERTSTPGAMELPRQQALCVRLVLDVARRVGCPVRVVDLSRQSAPQDVLESHPGEAERLPVLVRPDGTRLSGEEAFTAGRVRKFLTSARP